ncbi:sugar transferase [Mesorhizobium australicum]|uniref:Sugar transferase involved in LPS biosynthesis (Colanic, teichoic acid) n=1 Tax=Mesorhizobium australicum TaxID=536018 RepID=A0A1X7NTM0_9HYPH|nr:sugar transferase [Mesorhizobium australicum]SMH40593.1 Sugar transferase involved in LPS biosynthesis (colanic, teichoic acid) [Mesorhizobium australicum]
MNSEAAIKTHVKSPSTKARTKPAPYWLSQLLRLRFQLIGLLTVAALLPAFVRGGYTFAGMAAGNNLQTLTGVAAASVLGWFLHRRLSDFPGTLSTSYIGSAFAGSFGVTVLIYFLFRIDYSRSIFVVGFAVSIVWMYLVCILENRYKRFKLGFIPLGATGNLDDLDGVVWHRIENPAGALDGLDGIVVDLRADLDDVWERFIADAALHGVPVHHVKQIRESLTGRLEIEHLSENTLGSLNPNQVYLKVKHAADWIASALVLVVIWPLLLIVAVAIRIDSPGPALFIQERRGYRGINIKVIKFRTMRVGEIDPTDRESAKTVVADPRVTRIGRFLRVARIDELPQLFNILRGEMSLIGPRPEALPLSQWYESELPFYRYRHIVRPGISGWAQVNQGHVTEVDEVLDKLHYDFYYIKNFSLWLDLLIILKTVRTVIGGIGAR